ncbi:glycoside hydrolase family 1 protein [Flavobacterium lacustre]|uniref:glycoside hydrolase family 1 protein n=1 Tax=Flavobacterium lacustre TaxID=3016339 RepID=UPI0022B70DE0|nr:family 1 glycosylhydrolase [Flavobacterium lacustre]
MNNLNKDALLRTYDFGDNFLWGMSSSEHLSPKSRDETFFLNSKHQFSTIDVSFFKTELDKYKQDIDLIKQLGIPNFKFSLSWSKILPDGTGKISTEAINFYHDVLDICIENKIEPFVTLYDSCLPSVLEEKGGWSNREILSWFENYVAICVNSFKEKVSYWIVLNDPSFFTGAGHFLGIDSLGKKGANKFLPALHHAVLCQSIGFRIIKQIKINAQVGTFFSCHYIISNTYNDKDIKATERIDALLNRTFIEPLLGLGYPTQVLPFLKNVSKYSSIGDDDLIKVDFDFIGLQNCTREIASHDSLVPYLNAKLIKNDKIRVKKTHLNYHIYHELIYLIIKKYSKYECVKKIFIVENIAHPLEEIDFDITIGLQKANGIQSFLSQMLNAKQSGGKVNGYFVSMLKEFKPD